MADAGSGPLDARREIYIPEPAANEGRDEYIPVRVPLREPSGPWMEHYFALMRARPGLRAASEAREGVVLAVDVPVSSSRQEIFALLDAAVDLVDEAKAAENAQVGSRDATTNYIQEWWRRRRAAEE